ncbi:TetR/AcrR family transcriptional regulator [Streptomyces sp. bgisy031]|uniref:TetR/AcrR family transcriptional regulator n=1 Tax=Streptomyces sp. bgisy031 TaxID=3413772 RepID=UPI003D741623
MNPSAPLPQARSERRRTLVTLAAQLFAEKGYQATTVREIADAAGVLSGSLYHHFESKESIIDELLSDYLGGLIGTYREIVSVHSGPRETLVGLVGVAIRSLQQHRAAITVLQNERHHLAQLPRFTYVQDSENEVQDLWVQVITEGIKSGAFRSQLDPKVTYRLIRDAIWVAVRWFHPSGELSVEELTEQYLTVFMEGMAEPNAALSPAGAIPER